MSGKKYQLISRKDFLSPVQETAKLKEQVWFLYPSVYLNASTFPPQSPHLPACTLMCLAHIYHLTPSMTISNVKNMTDKGEHSSAHFVHGKEVKFQN